LVAACNAVASAFSRCSGPAWIPSAVEALGQWASDHQTEIETARTKFDRRNEAG